MSFSPAFDQLRAFTQTVREELYGSGRTIPSHLDHEVAVELLELLP
ncbi:hypothetical protein [Spirosoma harenae]